MPDTSADIKQQNLLAKLKRSFAQGSFSSNVATMMAGNILAQAIALFASPIITRLYGPDDFGSMTLIWSYVSIFSAIVCLRYESPIIIEKETENASNIFLLCIIIASCFSLLLGVGIFLFGRYLPDIIGLKGNHNLLWFVPLGVFVYGINKPLNHWLVRSKKFFLLSTCRVGNSFITAGTKITLGLFFLSSGFFLLAGNVAGLVGITAVFIVVILKRDFSQFKISYSKDTILAVAKKYRKFPQYHSITGLINSLTQNLPVMLFALFFSSEVVGFYGLANTLLRKPIQLMSGSLSKVFLQKAAHSHAQGQSLKKDLLSTTKGLAAIGFFPFGIILIGGRYIFEIFFGQEWATAGLFAQLLAPWLFMLFINPPSTQIIIVKQKLRFVLYYEICNSLLRILVISISYYAYSSPVITVACFSFSGVITNIYYLYFAYKQTTEK